MKARLANGIELEYESFGDTGAPPLILVMGLGTQMLGWPESLCNLLVERGLRVIRFDNRDVGLSTRFDGVPAPGALRLEFLRLLRRKPEVPYTLDDMASDVTLLMDHLELDSAHVAGASMGGMIAQLVALAAPSRVRSLCSIMSTTGNRSLPGPGFRLARHMFLKRPRAGDPEGYIEHTAKTLRMIGSPGYPTSDEDWKALVRRHVERAYYPEGFRRQLAAILTADERSSSLQTLKVPTLILHGTHDPLIPAAAARHTAEAIPASRLVLIEGMGHDLAETLCPEIARHLAEHALAAEQASGGETGQADAAVS